MWTKGQGTSCPWLQKLRADRGTGHAWRPERGGQGWQRRKAPSLPSASTLSLASGNHILSVLSYRWQKPDPWQEHLGETVGWVFPGAKKELGCVGMEGTAGLPTAAGS